MIRPRSEVVRQHFLIGFRKSSGRLPLGWLQTGEKYFSAKRTEAGNQDNMKRKWIVTVSPANRLKHRMAVTGQTNEEKKAAAVVKDVTNMDKPAWASVSITNFGSVVPSLSSLVHRQT